MYSFGVLLEAALLDDFEFKFLTSISRFAPVLKLLRLTIVNDLSLIFLPAPNSFRRSLLACYPSSASEAQMLMINSSPQTFARRRNTPCVSHLSKRNWDILMGR